MARHYGRGKGGRRVVDHVPLNRPKSMTILSSIRLDGELAFTTFSGGTTAGIFRTYLKDVLIPALRPGDIVVMDNLWTHHIQAAGELLRTAGPDVLYLPPYSSESGFEPYRKALVQGQGCFRKASCTFSQCA